MSERKWRSADGPRQIGGSLDRLFGRLTPAAASTLTSLIDHWEEIVGPEMAAATSPMKIEGDTVSVRCERAPYASHLKLHWEEFRVAGGSLGIDIPKSLTVVLKPK